MKGFLFYQLIYVALPIALLFTILVLSYRFFRACGKTYRIFMKKSLANHPQSTVLREKVKYRRANADVIVWLATTTVGFIVFIKVFEILSININGMIPVATVVAAGLGFGAQGLFKDVIQGALIILEKQYGMGDTITISPLGSKDGIVGEVETLTLRMTGIRTINGELLNMSNRNIEQVINMSTGYSVAVVDIPIPPPPTVDTNLALSILDRAGGIVYASPEFKDIIHERPHVMGVNYVGTHHLVIRIKVPTDPSEQWKVQREMTRVALNELAKAGISQVDIKAVND